MSRSVRGVHVWLANTLPVYTKYSQAVSSAESLRGTLQIDDLFTSGVDASNKKAMLSDSQILTVLALSGFSSALSLFGSASIIYLIAKKQTWRDSIFQRIMLNVSIADAIWSFGNMVHAFMIPSEAEHTVIAFGNAITCNVAGFVTGVLATSSLYSCVLSAYFFLKITRSWSEARTKRVFEPWIHVVSWGFPALLCILVLFSGGYQPSDFNVCLADRSDDASIMAKTVAAVSSLLILFPAVAGFVFIWLMYASVRRQQIRSQHYDFSEQDKQRRRNTKIVATQGIFYSLAFFNTFISLIISVVAEGYILDRSSSTTSEEPRIRKGVFYASLLLFVMLPLQGFLNWIVYIRPNLVQWKVANPEESWWWAYRQVMSGNPTPRAARGVSQGSKTIAGSSTMQLPESTPPEIRSCADASIEDGGPRD